MKILVNIIFLLLVISVLISGLLFRKDIYNLVASLRKQMFINKEFVSTDTDLLKENIELKSKLSELIYLEKDNELLRSAIETQHKFGNKLVEGNIIGFDNSVGKNLAILNIGENDGVKQNQSIVYMGYFVGKIAEVSKETSKVEFINSNQSNIGVRIQNSLQSEGVLKSNFGLELFIDLIPKTEIINVGDFVYTSGIGGIEEGVLVGTVKSIEEGDLFYKISLDYPFNLNKLYKVFVLQ